MADRIHAGKVIVITGASSGFGKGVARRFAAAGASVVLAARRGNLIDELARECTMLAGASASGADAVGLGSARAYETDVSNKVAVEALASETLNQFGRIDVWINNAGVGAYGRFQEIPLEDHVKVITTDLLGALFGSYFAIKQFEKQGGGTLINVASEVGKVPLGFLSSYSAAKHGVVGLTSAIRQEIHEMGPRNVHVCTVMPSAMDTPFFEHAANYSGHETVPPEPVYDPQEVIDVIFDLATTPRDEVVVGNAGKRAVFMHGLAPGRVERQAGHSHFKTVFEEAPPGPVTRGSVAAPMDSGTEVRGGWRRE
ncbi:MAG: SDR family NAD(P)-dependent oxidoreductase [Phycisphaerales bacterium]